MRRTAAVATALMTSLVVSVGVTDGAHAVGGPTTATEAPAPEATADQDRCFVGVSHMVFLDRPATEAEKTSWEARFASGEPRYRLPRQLATGDEWLTVVVTDLYQQALDRGPDPDGLAHWIDQLATVNDVRLAVPLASSTESINRAPSVCTTTTRITNGDDDSQGADISTDARHVAFQSYASDLVAEDTNGKGDVFTFDRTTGTTVRITDGNDDSYDPATSADGRHITFSSRASDLVPDDANGQTDVFTWDRTTGVTTRITDGDNDSGLAAISGDGRHVTFLSYASDLVADDRNGSHRHLHLGPDHRDHPPHHRRQRDLL